MMFWDKPVRINVWVDRRLLAVSLLLLALGLVMVSSSSLALAEKDFGDAIHFLKHQAAFAVLGAALAMLGYFVSPARVQASAGWLMACALIMLSLVLVPQIGKTVNGSRRWFDLGLINLQASEPVKLFVIVYFADYIARHRNPIARNFKQFVMPLAAVLPVIILLLMQPDYGAAVVISVVVFMMLWLAGVRLRHFVPALSVAAALLALLAIISPYRWERLIAFADPWRDPFGSGYQLTQSLIAIGSGGWFGLGLGDSVQKLFYLPETHTDFIFSILAEETGFAGVCAVVVLFWLFVQRCLAIGRRAEREGLVAGALYAYGIGVWFGVQAFINMAVAMGLLPTKGLTLPLISYGGSSLVVSMFAIGLLMRVHHETQSAATGAAVAPYRRTAGGASA